MSIKGEAFETDLVGHYGGDDLLASIEAGVAALGKSRENVTIEDLAPVDEFHIGGRPAQSNSANASKSLPMRRSSMLAVASAARPASSQRRSTVKLPASI